MKKLLGLVVLCLTLLGLSPLGCLAAESEMDYSAAGWLGPADGEWYSTAGALTMVIENNTINGFSVTNMQNCTFGYPRTGNFTIDENGKEKTIQLEVLGNKSHQYLVIDDNILLRRSLLPDYNESMGGIYLGMTKEDLKSLYKEPTSIVTEQGTEVWNYDAHKFAIVFKKNIISAIRMFKGSDRKFDKTLLGADDAPADYTTAYSFEEYPVAIEDPTVPSKGYKIPKGEFFYFRPDYVELSIYKNS